MVNQNTITIWPPGSNEEPQMGPKPFDAQNVAKFLKNYDDKNQCLLFCKVTGISSISGRKSQNFGLA